MKLIFRDLPRKETQQIIYTPLNDYRVTLEQQSKTKKKKNKIVILITFFRHFSFHRYARKGRKQRTQKATLK